MRRIASIGLILLVMGLAVVSIEAIAIPAMTGTQVVTIDRNSMQRVLPQGSMAFISKQDHYSVGDIITYSTNGNIVTHKIVELLPNPANEDRDGLWLQTKGTENSEVDPYTINKEQVLGRVVYSIPWAGMGLKLSNSPTIRLFLALLAIGMWWIATAPKGESPLARLQRRLTTHAAPSPIGRECYGCTMTLHHGANAKRQPGKGF